MAVKGNALKRKQEHRNSLFRIRFVSGRGSQKYKRGGKQ